MVNGNKAAWQTPKLATLDVERTLGGILPNFSETFVGIDLNGNTQNGDTFLGS